MRSSQQPHETGGGQQRDLEDRLRAIIKKEAAVRTVYGGFEISIEEPQSFPWFQVLELLTSVGQDVWIRRSRKGVLTIDSKPPSI